MNGWMSGVQDWPNDIVPKQNTDILMHAVGLYHPDIVSKCNALFFTQFLLGNDSAIL